jgi:hypothetical protein
MALDPKVWGPHYWFFLNTIALSYPKYPNSVTKKKYYEFIQNFPLFIPIENISTEFSNLIDTYPITPYLDNRDSFIKWVHFIHNKINEKIDKPIVSLQKFYSDYYEFYKPSNEKWKEFYKIKQKFIYFTLIILFIIFIYTYYDK